MPRTRKKDNVTCSCLSLDPAMYHTLKKLQVEDQRNAEYSCPTEPTLGVRKEESSGTISVKEPFYNTMEKPVSNEGLSSDNYDPVYNTLEDPLYLGFGCGGQNAPTGLQDLCITFWRDLAPTSCSVKFQKMIQLQCMRLPMRRKTEKRQRSAK